MSNIVYLHGFASSPSSTKARFFHSRFEVIGGQVCQPDLAEGNFEALTLTRQLEVVDRTVRESEPILVMGSSLGGFLASLYAARHPELVPALVLLAPAFGFARRWPRELGEAKMKAWKEAGAREVYHYGERRMCPIGYRIYEDALQYEQFPDVRQPTLIFQGRFDEEVDPSLAVQFSWGKPHVELELVDSDHQLLDVLEPIWERVAAFYQNLEPSGA